METQTGTSVLEEIVRTYFEANKDISLSFFIENAGHYLIHINPPLKNYIYRINGSVISVKEFTRDRADVLRYDTITATLDKLIDILNKPNELHKHLVPITDVRKIARKDTLTLAMEMPFMDLPLLGAVIEKEDVNGFNKKSLSILINLCDAVEFMHSQLKLVHGDITPRNAFVDIDNNLKVILFDYDTTKRIGPNPDTDNEIGTPFYAPPEIVSQT